MVPWLIVLAAGCLERVTGEAVPLDPRFYAGHEGPEQLGPPPVEAGGPPDGGAPDGARDPGGAVPVGAGAGPARPPGPSEAPWPDLAGPAWTLAGSVVTRTDGAIQLDVAEPSAELPGGMRRAGAIRMAGAGAFSVRVPTTVRKVRLQAFQDLDGDGPDEDDPFAEAQVAWSGSDPAPVVLTLVAGGRGPSRPELVGGAPPTPTPAESEERRAATATVADAPDPARETVSAVGTVLVSGTVSATRRLPVTVDFFRVDPSGEAGRSYVGREVAEGGRWSRNFARGYGAIEVEAYQDLTGNARTSDDPATREAVRLAVGDTDLRGVALSIP